MAERLRFHLDEHVNPRIAQALRRHGIDVTMTVEAGIRGTSDNLQLEFARREGRILVTHDQDFLRLASQFDQYPGIVFCAKQRADRSMGEVIRGLILIYEVLSAEEMIGQVEYL